jgi:hypothetical protein
MKYGYIITIPSPTDAGKWQVDCWYGVLDTDLDTSVMQHLPYEESSADRDAVTEKSKAAARQILNHQGITYIWPE